jgi:molecular chaperone GrpE
MKLRRDSETQPQLEQQLAEALRQAEVDREALRQTRTAFLEYRRRAEIERAEGVTTAQVELLAQLLPIIDDLRRAFGATAPEYAESPWAQGIFLVAKRLATALSTLGLKRFGGAGTIFNPHYHDVLTTQTRPDLPEGTIIQVVLPGYVFAGHILRPAQVVVSTPHPQGGRPPAT